MKTALLSSTFFGPIQWYQKLANYDSVLVEHHDHYQKQTYRNRCIIATAQGTQALTVPAERGNDDEVRISNHGAWRRIHWNALTSAYSESPFFEYYADDLRPFFEREWHWLYDYNLEICHTMCQLLDIQPQLNTTATYEKEGPWDDYRDIIRPKHPGNDPQYSLLPYYQVFAARHGFLPNLSILDLLFNMGPEGIYWLINNENK